MTEGEKMVWAAAYTQQLHDTKDGLFDTEQARTAQCVAYAYRAVVRLREASEVVEDMTSDTTSGIACLEMYECMSRRD